MGWVAPGHENGPMDKYGTIPCHTLNTTVGCLQVGHEVSLTGMQVDQVPNIDITALSCRALTVEVTQYVGRTTNIEVTINTSTYPHSTVHRRRH